MCVCVFVRVCRLGVGVGTGRDRIKGRLYIYNIIYNDSFSLYIAASHMAHALVYYTL